MQHKATRSWSLPAIILAFVLAAALVAQVLTQAAVSNQAFAAQTTPISDGNTTTSYTDSLGENNSTRYAGRVWTDKTVYTENAVFTGTVDGESKRYEITNDSDFLVAYSALATSQAISGETKVPVDVVFVIDNSNSMDANLPTERPWETPQTRLEATVDAVNASIKQIMESNENSRVAVVIYGLGVETLLPLGHYSPLRSGNYIDLDSQYIDGGWFGSSGNRTTFTAPDNRRVTMDPGDRGTNTHMGVDRGMDILATASDITSELPNGSTVKHVPALILLSDGASTAAGDNDWWNPSGRRGDGTADNASTSYTFAVAMNAAYQKQRVNEHYEVQAGSDYAAKIYTIGMGIEQLSDTDYYRAQMALDPGTHINDNNNVAETIKDAWDWYVNGKYVGWNGTTYEPRIDGWTFEHPTSGDINGNPEALHYNDGYYAAENAEDVVNVFDDITGSILTGAPSVPTKVEGDPVEDGYITYTDPIGPYMEVSDVKAILWSGTLFEQKSSSTSGNTTTYAFEGTINSPVYGEHELSEIIIEVTTAADGEQTLTVKIPAACIPLRVNSVTLDPDGNVKSNESNGAYPFRLLYTVDLQEGVVDGEGRVNSEVVSKDYIAANTEDGLVNFYSNRYSGQEGENGMTQGDATVSFSPALDNPFYFVQENTPLYLDEGKTVATHYDRDDTYYFQISYYEGTELKTDWVQRSADLMEGYTEVINGQLNLKAGSPRLGYLTQFIKDKGNNTTNTAQAYYYPTFQGSNPQDGNFVVYLGNNGKLQVDAPQTPPGDLTISKTVGGNQGQTDRGFSFDITLTNTAEPLSGSYAYTKTNADATLTSGIVSVDGEGKAVFTPQNGAPEALTLKHGESVTISDLPAGTSFTVTEQDPNTAGEEYKTSIAIDDGASQPSEDRTVGGVIESGQKKIAYHNHWDIQMHSFAFTKIDGNNINAPLSGAQFKLFEPVCQDPNHNHEEEPIADPFEPGPTCWKLVTDAEHTDGVFTSDQEGKISFNGLLKNGVTYRLIEVQAPEGFQRPQGQWNLTITQEGEDGSTEVRVSTKAVGAMNSQPAFKVEGGLYYLPNYRPVDPPITGGRGMTGFMLGGGLLIALGLSAAAFWLIRSSKQKRDGYRYR